MASINSFADVMQDWEGLLAALKEHAELQTLLDSERQELEKTLTQARDLKAQQEAQAAGRQGLTQQIKEVVAQGKTLAITIRSVAKGKIGFRSERLVHFKVSPVRRRPRKPAAAVTPPAGQSTGQAGAPQTPAPGAGKPGA